MLVQRGITNFEDAKNYFRPDLNNLHDPWLMKDMDKAVETGTKLLHDGCRQLVLQNLAHIDSEEERDGATLQ